MKSRWTHANERRTKKRKTSREERGRQVGRKRRCSFERPRKNSELKFGTQEFKPRLCNKISGLHSFL